ncbi:MAG: MBL fold metallo-hydrolase [Thermoproteota archaeon]|jgi:ribonuclease J
METNITLYGGVNEVGGNKILISTREASIMLDFGLSYQSRRKFFSDPFIIPRDVETLVKLGVVPNVPGMYSEKLEKPFDALFLSHAHRDHTGHIGLLRKDIPTYAGEASLNILKALNEVSRKSIESDIHGKILKSFHTGDIIKLDNLEIAPIHVDHSTPGSYGFIIKTPEGSIAYTGDFRMHGPKFDMTADFIRKMKDQQIEVLITEHTNMLDGVVSSEKEVEEKISEITHSCEGLVIGDFAIADIDRYNSFYNAAMRNGRQLVITPKRAAILNSLRNDRRINVRVENTFVLVKEKSRTYDWEEKIFKEWKTIEPEEVSKKQKEFLVLIPQVEMQQIFKISPIPGSVFIFSSSEPFNEELEIDYDRLINWLDAMGVPMYTVHVSGHIMPIHLKRVIREVRPKKVVPIHGENPELFKKYVEDLNVQVEIPKVESKISLG